MNDQLILIPMLIIIIIAFLYFDLDQGNLFVDIIECKDLEGVDGGGKKILKKIFLEIVAFFCL